MAYRAQRLAKELHPDVNKAAQAAVRILGIVIFFVIFMIFVIFVKFPSDGNTTLGAHEGLWE